MKYLIKHKFTALVIVVFVFLVILLFIVYDFFFSGGKNPEYGNRLDGIEEVEIKEDKINKIESSLKDNKKVKSVETNIIGRTLDIVITVDDSVEVKEAKSIGNDSFKSLDEDQIKYYAIQIFVKKGDSSKNNFPIIGYKQKGKTSVIWTKDREVTKTNETK